MDNEYFWGVWIIKMIYYDTNLFELLTYNTEEYTNIMIQMLNDDFYILQDKTYDMIQLLYSKEILVGYIASSIINPNSVQINLVYIIREFRGNNIFVDYLVRDYIGVYDEVIIDMPNRFTINALVKNGLACYVSDDVVETNVLLSYTDECGELVVSNKYNIVKCGVVDTNNSTGLSPLQDIDVRFFHADCFR